MVVATSRFGVLLQRYHQQLRDENGRHVSVSRLTREVGIDRSYYYKLLNDPGLHPSRDLVVKIARALQAPVDEFLLAAGFAPAGMHGPVEGIGSVQLERLLAQYSDRVEMAFYGDVGCGNMLAVGDYYSETKLIPRHLANKGDSVVRAFGYSMDLAGIYPNSFLIVRHQDHAQHRQIVIANVEELGCTCKRYIRRADQAFLVSESTLSEYYDIPVNRDVRVVGVVKACWYEREFV